LFVFKLNSVVISLVLFRTLLFLDFHFTGLLLH